MKERIKALRKQAGTFSGKEINEMLNGSSSHDATLDLFLEKFAELIEQNCIDKFIKVWYEQGLDVQGAKLDKFMKRYEELDDGS
jgi:hypothetical protein